MIHPGKLAAMTEWASRFGCTIQTKGEVGFGRPCVGVLYGQAYVETSNGEYMGDYQVFGPPAGVTDAYHKHDCMAVLVRPDGDWENIPDSAYDAALEQLWIWIQWAEEQGLEIRTEERKTFNKDGFGRTLELLMGGPTTARLVRP